MSILAVMKRVDPGKCIILYVIFVSKFTSFKGLLATEGQTATEPESVIKTQRSVRS